MDLRELRLTLRRHVGVCVLVFSVVFGLGLAAAFLPSKTFATSGTLVVGIPVRDGVAGSVQQATYLVPGIVTKAESRQLSAAAGADVEERYRSARVRISATADASVLRIRGQGGNPVAVAAWVNAIIERLVIEQPADSPIELKIIDLAPVKRKAISPKVEPLVVGGLIAAFVFSIFAGLIAERIRVAFDTTQTVRDQLGTTVLGEVPSIRALGRSRRALLGILDEGRPPELLDAFDVIRTNLEFRLADTRPSMIAIASYDMGAGKSTMTAALGWALAGVGHNVTLLDADLRRPTLHDYVGMRIERGLGDLAAAAADLPYVQPTGRPGLGFVSAGLPSGRPADAVSVALPRAVEALKGPNQLLLIDSPPLAGVAESVVVAATAGYVILVVDHSMRELNHLPAALDRIRESGAVLLGVIVNRVPRRRFRKGVAYSYRNTGRTGKNHAEVEWEAPQYEPLVRP